MHVLAIMGFALAAGYTVTEVLRMLQGNKLANKQLDLEKLKIGAEREGLDRASREKLALTDRTMTEARDMKTLDYDRMIAMMREERAENREERNTNLQMQMIQNIVGRGREFDPPKPGQEIPMTSLIGLYK